MNMVEAVRTVLSQYATFSGRATRPEYWWWVLAVFLLSIVTKFIDGALFGFERFADNAVQPLTAVVGLALLLPSIAVAARRLHDIGRSGWWLLIGFIPVIGWLVILYWVIQPTQQGENEYG